MAKTPKTRPAAAGPDSQETTPSSENLNDNQDSAHNTGAQEPVGGNGKDHVPPPSGDRLTPEQRAAWDAAVEKARIVGALFTPPGIDLNELGEIVSPRAAAHEKHQHVQAEQPPRAFSSIPLEQVAEQLVLLRHDKL